MTTATQKTVTLDSPETFGERVSKIYKRMHRADKRNTGMYLNYAEVGDLAFALSNQISSVVYPDES